jgi:tetratricopeptide (TPR) repeat protein
MAGVLQGSDEKTKTQGAIKDLQYLRALGLAYALTDDVRYLNQGVTYLTAWAQTCQPTEDPIDATTLEPLLESYELLRPRMEETDRKTVDEWVKSVAYTLRDSDNPRKGSHWNNHQTHRLKTIAMVAFLLNDSDLEKQTLDSLKILMEKNLNPDGTTLDFLQRDALHYHFYDLQAFIRIAILYQRGMDVDLFHLPTGQGASVSQCLAFGLPYARGEKTHAEFVNSTVIFDAQRGANGESTYISGSAYQPKDALHCLELAQYYEPELTPLVGNLAEKPGSAYPTWRVLLNEAMRSGPLPVATTATTSVSVATKDPTAEDYHSALTDYRQGQYALAVSAFQKVLQANPASWQAEQGLGSAQNMLGNKAGAIQAYQKCLKLNPNNPPVKAALDGLMPAPTPP